jgi:hypothetical protein
MRADHGANRRDPAERAQIAVALLEVCGERGYQDLAVQHVLDRYGGYRKQFYGWFANKGDAYAAGYSDAVDDLCDRLLAAAAGERGQGRQGEDAFRRAVAATLENLAAFVCDKPGLARALLLDVHIAGGDALGKREKALRRLGQALDGARLHAASCPPLPPISADFLVGVVDWSVTSALVDGRPERFAAAVPELVERIAEAYFGRRRSPPAASGSPKAYLPSWVPRSRRMAS